MSRGTVLVLDAHSRAGVESAQALGRAGIEVHAASDSPECLAFFSRYVRHAHRQQKGLSPGQTAAWATELDNRFAYRLIVPSTEYSLLAVRTLPENSTFRAKCVVPSDDAIDTSLQKQKTLELAGRLGIPVPATTLIEKEATGTSPLPCFPVVLKPNRSLMNIDGEVQVCSPVIVMSEAERKAWLSKLLAYGAVQQQEYVRGTGVGIEFLYDRGQHLWHFAHRRLHEYPLTGGGSTYRCAIAPPAQLLTAAGDLLSALNWNGIAMVEFKVRDDGSFVLMEINPRLFGSLALAIDAGVNFPLGLFQLACGNRLPPQPRYKTPYYTRHVPDDIRWQLDNLRADRKNPLLHTKPRIRTLLEMFRVFRGRESWDHFDLTDLRPTAVMLRRIWASYSRFVPRLLAQPWRKRLILLRHRRLVRRFANSSGSPASILFLCYGNICRSPLAAALARGTLPEIAIESAGAHYAGNRLCPPSIVAEGRMRGIDLSDYRSSTVTQQQVRRADLILVMDTRNYEWLQRRFPAALTRTTMLGLFAPAPAVNIPDPYGKPEPEVARICDQIASAVEGVTQAIRQRFRGVR